MTQIVAYVSQFQSALWLKFPWIWTSVANKKLLFKRNCMYVQIDSLLFLEESRTIWDITNVTNKRHGSERALKLYLFWFFRYQCIIYDVDVGLNTQHMNEGTRSDRGSSPHFTPESQLASSTTDCRTMLWTLYLIPLWYHSKIKLQGLKKLLI